MFSFLCSLFEDFVSSQCLLFNLLCFLPSSVQFSFFSVDFDSGDIERLVAKLIMMNKPQLCTLKIIFLNIH